MKKDYFPSLTGIRAIAAYLVFVHHFCLDNTSELPAIFYNFLKETHVGVPIFFVLSGFLISYRYMDDLVVTPSWFLNYIKNRVARIYPLYFLITMLSLSTFKSIFVLILNLLMIKAYFIYYRFTGIGSGWTLSVEETFYLLCPFMLLLLNKKISLLFQFILLQGIGVVLVLIFSQHDFYSFMGSFKHMYLYTFFGRCFEFIAGIYLAIIIRKQKAILLDRPYFTFAGIALFILVVFGLSLLQNDQYSIGQYHPWGIFLNNIILPIPVLIIFYGLINENSSVKNFLSTPLLQLLGKSSYAFYLIHKGVFMDFIQKNISNNLWIDFILLNLIAIILYYAIESPANNLIRSIGRKKVPKTILKTTF